MTAKINYRVEDADKHELDINCLLYQNEKLYSGSDDGKVKCWSADLKKIAEVQSNSCSVLSLAANENCLYSCSNEGTIKSFDLDSLTEKSILKQDPQIEFWKLRYSDGCLFSGDDKGNVQIWKDEILYGTLNVSEPIKDMVVKKEYLFSASMDVVVTELKLESKRLQFGLKKTLIGGPPITLIGDKYFAFLSREATDIIVHENNNQLQFPQINKTCGASEKIINALEGVNWNNQYILFSGGWDKNIKKWIIDGTSIKLDSVVDVGMVINAITVGKQGEVYVGGSDGYIVRVDIK